MRRNVAMFVSALPVIGLTLSGCGGAVSDDGRSDASAITRADTISSLDQAAAICETLTIGEQGGCSIGDRPAPTDGGRSDQGQLDGSVEAGAPDRPEQGDAPAACTGPFKDRWGICPATFDGHPETFGCRFRASGVVRAAVIDGRQVLEWSNFPTMVQCIYASVNNGAALVGEINIADSLLFCDRTSYSQAFGSVPGCLPWSCDLADLCTPSSCTCPPDAGAWGLRTPTEGSDFHRRCAIGPEDEK